MDLGQFIIQNFHEFLTYTAFANATVGNLIMIAVGAFFIWLAIKKDFEPLLLVPIGLGIILGNIPFRADAGLEIGLYEDNSVLNIFYQGVRQGWYPPLIFLGIGAMTDFTALLANPKLMLIGASAQFGIFGAYMVALAMGFEPSQAAGIAIIGGADGPTAIFLSSKLSPNLMGAIAVCAYSYMALVPVIQPFIMRLLTTEKERVIKMKPGREVDRAHPLPNHRIAAHHLHRTFRSSSAGYALLRQSAEGKWQDHPSGKDSWFFTQRHRSHVAGSDCWLLYSGQRVPDLQYN